MVNTTFCSVCDLTVKSNAFSAHLKSRLHKNNSLVIESDGIEKVHSAFRSRIASYRVRCEAEERNSDSSEASEERARPPAEFLSRLRRRVRSLLSARLQTHNSLKVNFELF